MVILIKQDKSLVITGYSRIYQKENAVNSLTFYCPQTLDEVEDMSTLYPVLYYTNSVNEAFVEFLSWEPECDKEGYLMCKLGVDSKFTNAAGTNVINMAFTADREGTEVVLHTGTLEVIVYQWDNAFKFVSSDGLAAIVNKIHELEGKSPDDLMLDNDILHLAKKDEETAELTPLGDGVEILIPGDKDHEDSDHDGIIDIDDLPDGSTPGEYDFIEL